MFNAEPATALAQAIEAACRDKQAPRCLQLVEILDTEIQKLLPCIAALPPA